MYISNTCMKPIQLRFFGVTVKPVFKGHSDERTTCDQGTSSYNGVLSSPMLKNL